MKWRVPVLFMAAALFGLAGSSANANFITYLTPTGATAGGQPVDASVSFTTSADAITLVLTNLQVDPKSVVQNLSGLFFTLDTGQNVGSLLSSTSTERTVNGGGGTFTDGGVVSTGWGLTTSGPGFRLNDLGFAGPAHTLIGPQNSGTGKYSNANASIAGNGPHNPFLNQTATFVINAVGVSADSTVNSAMFAFGTADGVNVTGNDPASPEPASLVMVGIGLGLTSLFALRHRWAKRPVV